MAKKKQLYTCLSCGEEFGKWNGRCTACGEWNTITEVLQKSPSALPDSHAVLLRDVGSESLQRAQTGISEFDLVCGGGLVPGSVVLVGGEPGIGKSTLAMQIAGSFRTLYISGEESPVQLKHRADRLGGGCGKITVSTATAVSQIQALIDREKPECVIIDSVQTLSVSDVNGVAGSMGQIRESTARLVETAKTSGIPIILIGHITKDGLIAGPKMLEHLVDTVLYFEGDFSRDYRILRSFKNRYGSVNEIGLFRMTGEGLIEIRDRNSIFLNPYANHAPGSAVSAAIEGSRIILFEVQALVTFTNFSNPRRMSDGFDLNRAILIAAVLEKHASLKISSFDVFINVAGGFSIRETSADLAVAVAISSSMKEQPLPERSGFLGEISLSGEIRPVPQCQRRAMEFSRSGFTKLYVSKQDAAEAKEVFGGEVVAIETMSQAVNRLFGD